MLGWGKASSISRLPIDFGLHRAELIIPTVSRAAIVIGNGNQGVRDLVQGLFAHVINLNCAAISSPFIRGLSDKQLIAISIL